MSKDIWHSPSEAPAYCFLCVFENSFDGEIHCGHYNPVKKQFCSTEGRYEINQVQKYCDLLHLLDCEQELIRIRKALDVAVDALKEINDRYESEEQRGREEDDSPDWWDFAMDTGEILTKAIEQITALEQKE